MFSGSDGDLAETLPVGASDYLACDDLEMVLLFRGLKKTQKPILFYIFRASLLVAGVHSFDARFDMFVSVFVAHQLVACSGPPKLGPDFQGTEY